MKGAGCSSKKNTGGFMQFPIKTIAKTLIEYLSNLVGLAIPGSVTPEQAKNVQNYVTPVYAAAKTIGNTLVNSSANDLDDEVLEELVQICENVAEKYGFELDATAIPLT
jgi:hypothetical protein